MSKLEKNGKLKRREFLRTMAVGAAGVAGGIAIGVALRSRRAGFRKAPGHAAVFLADGLGEDFGIGLGAGADAAPAQRRSEVNERIKRFMAQASPARAPRSSGADHSRSQPLRPPDWSAGHPCRCTSTRGRPPVFQRGVRRTLARIGSPGCGLAPSPPPSPPLGRWRGGRSSLRDAMERTLAR